MKTLKQGDTQNAPWRMPMLQRQTEVLPLLNSAGLSLQNATGCGLDLRRLCSEVLGHAAASSCTRKETAFGWSFNYT